MVRWGLFFARNFFPFREGLHSRLREKVRGKRKQGLLQVERNPDIFRKKRPSVRREEKGERPCPKGACHSEGDCDGRLVRDTEGALRSPEGQGQDEADGNRYKIEILMSRKQKLTEVVADSLRLKTLDYNPYF